MFIYFPGNFVWSRRRRLRAVSKSFIVKGESISAEGGKGRNGNCVFSFWVICVFFLLLSGTYCVSRKLLGYLRLYFLGYPRLFFCFFCVFFFAFVWHLLRFSQITELSASLFWGLSASFFVFYLAPTAFLANYSVICVRIFWCICVFSSCYLVPAAFSNKSLVYLRFFVFYLRLFPFRVWILAPKSNRKSTNQQ